MHDHIHIHELPDDTTREALILIDSITRFIALLTIYDPHTLEVAAGWLKDYVREIEGDATAIRDRYILTTAIDLLIDAAQSDDANNTTMERTPQDELVTLRLSIARLAQAVGIDAKSPKFANFDSVISPWRNNNRGWNKLISLIQDKFELQKAEGNNVV